MTSSDVDQEHSLSVGQYLKSERERLKIPLQEIVEITKISRPFLEAIEEDAFDKLPGEIFIRGFIKGYASYLRLDIDEVMYRYHEQIATPSDVIDNVPSGHESPYSGVDIGSGKSVGRLKWVVIAAGLFFVVFWVGNRFVDRERNSHSMQTITTSQPASATVVAAVDPVVADAKIKPATNKATGDVQGSLESPKPEVSEVIDDPMRANLSVNIVGAVHMSVIVDSVRVKNGEFGSGASFNWRFHESLELIVSDTHQINVIYNNLPIPTAGIWNQDRRFVFYNRRL